MLDLADNQLTGEITAALGTLSKLRVLDLGANRLTSPIPAVLGGLSELEHVDLSGNQLTGDIPTALGTLSKLQLLDLGANRLTSPIPAALGGLSSLEQLHVSDNRLTGPMPMNLTNLDSLAAFHWEENDRGGTVPLCARSAEAFQDWLAGIADKSGPDCTDRDILAVLYEATDGPNWKTNHNWLSDAPTGDWYGARTGPEGRVTWLDLSENELVGMLPTELGDLSRLEALDLGYNRLTGEVPLSFTNLRSLIAFDWRENDGLCAPDTAEFDTWLATVPRTNGPTCESGTPPVTRLTNHPASDYAASWSPDGTRIVFWSNANAQNHNPQIYVMNADGSGMTRLTNSISNFARGDSTVYRPGWWSPDGSRILFAALDTDMNHDTNFRHLYVMNADGSGQTRLTDGINVAAVARPWSPDGTRIVFWSERGGKPRDLRDERGRQWPDAPYKPRSGGPRRLFSPRMVSRRLQDFVQLRP